MNRIVLIFISLFTLNIQSQNNTISAGEKFIVTTYYYTSDLFIYNA